ncbi:hypothetical protein LQW54_002475 [Pestalotiopsis sp. IQ-011]
MRRSAPLPPPSPVTALVVLLFLPCALAGTFMSSNSTAAAAAAAAAGPYGNGTATNADNSTAFGVNKSGSDDCANAYKWKPFASVNCYYDWEHTGGANALNYVIQISGTGQRQAGWCARIADNIASKCGVPANTVDAKSCGTDNIWTYPPGHDYDRDVDVDLFGIDHNVWLTKWDAGGDDKACVAEAIRAATCHTVNLETFECYKRS